MNASSRLPSLYGGRFELGKCLGDGAVGVVYEAFDREQGRHVALKMLRAMEPELLLSLKTEFRAVHDLEHPNLVKLGELFEDGGQWFFTMELVHGEDFLQHVRDETRLRPALLQLARALGALHAAQLVHRDVKPSNVLVARGRVVLLDFGLATRVVLAGGGLDEGMCGTVAYMAPEQVSAEGAGPPADWYAFGVVLFQALTGRLPFTGSAHEVLEQKLVAEAPSVHDMAPEAPADLSALCDALLHVDPAQRAGEREVLALLSPVLGDAVVANDTALGDEAWFVGRARELAVLTEARRDVARGVATSVVVHGESGVGKSFLVRTFCERMLLAEPSTLVLHGRCYERESVPYKAVDGAIDDLRRFLRDAAPEDLKAWLPADVKLLVNLFPVLSDLTEFVDHDDAAPVLENGLELRRRAFLALRDLLARIAGTRPVLLIVDDLQWADADSRALLLDVLRPPGAPLLLLVATRRVMQGAEAVSPAEERLPGEVRELSLAALPASDASELANRLLGSEADDVGVVSSIAAESGGHPLFIAELVRRRRAHRDGGPLRLDDALWARVEALGRESRAVLAHVCVAGRPLPQDVAAVGAGVERSALFQIVAQLRAANLLRTTGVRRRDLMEPFHDRVREAVVARLDPDVRRDLHLHLARAFELTGTDDPDALAMHWRGAGHDERAAHYASLAGDRAARALAFERAALFYQQARELGGKPDRDQTELLEKLSRALTNAGRGAESAELCLVMAASSSGAQALELRRSGFSGADRREVPPRLPSRALVPNADCIGRAA